MKYYENFLITDDYASLFSHILGKRFNENKTSLNIFVVYSICIYSCNDKCQSNLARTVTMYITYYVGRTIIDSEFSYS